MGEAELIAKSQAGDSDALGSLLTSHQQPCYALALRLSGSDADAEDVCQDAFLRASRDIGRYRPIGSFRSWLFALVVHAYGDRLDSERARRVREEAAAMSQQSTTAAKPDVPQQRDLRRQLDRSLRRLADRYRVPIVLHYEQGLSYAEAAAVLEVPEGTVATNIRRGLEELKGFMIAAGYACTVPAMTGALAQGLAVAVPAKLTAFIQGLTVSAGSGAAVAGKAAAGAVIKTSARLGAQKAAGLALGWKAAAVATAVTAGAVATPLVIDAVSGKPAAVAPADDSGLAAAAAGCRTVADLRALAPRVRAVCERSLAEPDFDIERVYGLEFGDFACRQARYDWQVPSAGKVIAMALARPERVQRDLGAKANAWKPHYVRACLLRHEERYAEARAALKKAETAKGTGHVLVVNPMISIEEHYILVGQKRQALSGKDWESVGEAWPIVAGYAGIPKLAALWLWADAVDMGMPTDKFSHGTYWPGPEDGTYEIPDVEFPVEIREAAAPLIEFLEAHREKPQDNSR